MLQVSWFFRSPFPSEDKQTKLLLVFTRKVFYELLSRAAGLKANWGLSPNAASLCSAFMETQKSSKEQKIKSKGTLSTEQSHVIPRVHNGTCT